MVKRKFVNDVAVSESIKIQIKYTYISVYIHMYLHIYIFIHSLVERCFIITAIYLLLYSRNKRLHRKMKIIMINKNILFLPQ